MTTQYSQRNMFSLFSKSDTQTIQVTDRDLNDSGHCFIERIPPLGCRHQDLSITCVPHKLRHHCRAACLVPGCCVLGNTTSTDSFSIRTSWQPLSNITGGNKVDSMWCTSVMWGCPLHPRSLFIRHSTPRRTFSCGYRLHLISEEAIPYPSYLCWTLCSRPSPEPSRLYPWLRLPRLLHSRMNWDPLSSSSRTSSSSRQCWAPGWLVSSQQVVSFPGSRLQQPLLFPARQFRDLGIGGQGPKKTLPSSLRSLRQWWEWHPTNKLFLAAGWISSGACPFPLYSSSSRGRPGVASHQKALLAG